MSAASLEEQLSADLRRAACALEAVQAQMRAYSAACTMFDWYAVKVTGLAASANLDVYLDALASAHRKLEIAHRGL